MKLTAHPKVWFVTGSSTGLGRAFTEYVLTQGHIVVATLRKPSDLDDLTVKYHADQLLVLKLDVSKPQDISDAFNRVKEVFGRLDVVVNNAAYSILGEIEGTSDEIARNMFDVNFWGAANVSRAAVQFFREVNKPGVGGRLINISSAAGIHPLPTCGFYSASKLALEGFTQALSGELDPDWNIKISLVDLGGFKSDALTRSAIHLPVHPAYTKPGLPATVSREFFARKDTVGDPRKVVVKWYELAQLSDPPMRLVLGKDAVRLVRTQIEGLTKDLDAREDWSNDLTFN